MPQAFSVFSIILYMTIWNLFIPKKHYAYQATTILAFVERGK